MRQLRALIYKWISKRFMPGCSNFNSLQVRKSCRSKLQARTVFAGYGVPHAKGEVFFWPWRAFAFARQFGFPLVIKPNVSGFSRGSYFPIENKGELWRAILKAKLWWPTTVVEQYLNGANYRVLCSKDDVISIIRRYPPFVVGDGKHTISQLIDLENKTREQMGLYPVMHPLTQNHDTRNYLKKQGMDFTTIPTPNEKVDLYHRIALAPGGVVETINIETVPERNLALFKRIVSHFDANVLGIDVIFQEGIEKAFTDQKCIFIEVNSRPYIKMHDFPRYGEKQDISAAMNKLESLQIKDKDIF